MLRPSFETLASQAPQDEVCYGWLILSLHENLGLAPRFRLQPVDVMATLMLGRRIARRRNPLPRGADDCDERYWHGMNRFTKALLVLAAFALGVVLWWKINYPTYAWNQKLTVTVSTPGGRFPGLPLSLSRGPGISFHAAGAARHFT
jgi:hypothetical protein